MAGMRDKGPRTTLHMADNEGAGGRKRQTQCGKNNFAASVLKLLLGNTGSDDEGHLLELISWSKSLKVAFSKSQQYKALFLFSLLSDLVNTLKFTFSCAVTQRCHQCLLRLVSENFIVSIKSYSSLWWVQTSLISADSGKKVSSVTEAQHRQEWSDGRC